MAIGPTTLHGAAVGRQRALALTCGCLVVGNLLQGLTPPAMRLHDLYRYSIYASISIFNLIVIILDSWFLLLDTRQECLASLPRRSRPRGKGVRRRQSLKVSTSRGSTTFPSLRHLERIRRPHQPSDNLLRPAALGCPHPHVCHAPRRDSMTLSCPLVSHLTKNLNLLRFLVEQCAVSVAKTQVPTA